MVVCKHTGSAFAVRPVSVCEQNGCYMRHQLAGSADNSAQTIRVALSLDHFCRSLLFLPCKFGKTLTGQTVSTSGLSSLKLHDIKEAKITRHGTRYFNLSVFIRCLHRDRECSNGL